mmetsp:Transcript_50883/g.119239  ORF Transcript_50883/g.119239 Transcript_50883/m.119239 type:complete len:201 (-) Transcript_50883:159-761(-)
MIGSTTKMGEATVNERVSVRLHHRFETCSLGFSSGHKELFDAFKVRVCESVLGMSVDHPPERQVPRMRWAVQQERFQNGELAQCSALEHGAVMQASVCACGAGEVEKEGLEGREVLEVTARVVRVGADCGVAQRCHRRELEPEVLLKRGGEGDFRLTHTVRRALRAHVHGNIVSTHGHGRLGPVAADRNHPVHALRQRAV